MSSLKDIINSDVEPLQSQASYRGAKEAFKELAPPSSNARSSVSPSPSLDDTIGKTTIRRRRANRVSKSGGQPSPSSRPNVIQRRKSAAGETMDFNAGYQAGGSNQASVSGSPPQTSSRESEHGGEVPVKYTPVTGRISKAKKGVPVHTCDICRPVKTFTRAEHLRRHQLSHQKPAYPCTFKDCQRAFHRPDLLSRHLQRHETQGDQPYKSSGGDHGFSSSQGSPGPSRGRTPPLKVETPSQMPGDSTAANQVSPTDSDITPRTSGGNGGGSMTAFSDSAVFQPVSYSPAPSHKRTATEAELQGTDPYSAISPSTSRAPANFSSHMHNFTAGSGPDLSNQGTYGRAQQSFNPYENGGSGFSGFVTPPHSVPSLRIQTTDDNFFPDLSNPHDNSPWHCSSASDSTYSTQSEGSRSGHWNGQRGRSGSNAAEWPNVVGYSPRSLLGTPQDLRNLNLGDIMDDYENPPYTPSRVTPPVPPRQLLDIPTNYNVITNVFPFFQPHVDTPDPTAFDKQLFSSSMNNNIDPRMTGMQKMEPSQQLGALNINSDMAAGYPMESAQQDMYLESYWNSFHQLFPVIHRGTFDPAANDLLTTSMTAIGTQYHDSPEARREGMEMNEYCKKTIDHFPMWNLHTMQGILLTEIFARFRGRKTSVRLSSKFEELYKRLLSDPAQIQSPFMSHAPSFSSQVDPFSPHPSTPQQMRNQDLRSEWLDWIDTESRQRLLCFCFIFDVTQSIYHEQNRSKANPEGTSSRMFLPCAENLWSASDASQWKLQQNDFTLHGYSLNLMDQNQSGQYSVRRSPFTQAIHVCTLATSLPAREDRYPNEYHPEDLPVGVGNLSNIFPNDPTVHAFLSIHYTPLHDLLAISGDTWVFARKIPLPAAFQAAQQRLRVWSQTLAAAAATHHACIFLNFALAEPYVPSSSTQSEAYSGTLFSISDYWALYTSALICWAFGHHRQQTVSRSSSATAINTSEMEAESPDTPTVDEDRIKALMYVNGMLDMSVEDLSKANMRGDTAGVIDSVRLRLEQIGVGGKCMTIVDAIYVLKKLNAGGRARFF